MAAEAFDHLDAPPLKITGADVPMPYAANLEKLALPSVEQVVAAAKVRLLPGVTAHGRSPHELEARRVPLRRRALRGAGARRDRGQGLQLLDLPHDRLSASHRAEQERFRLLKGEDKLTTYSFNTGTAQAPLLLRVRNKELLRAALQARRL